MKIGGKEVVLSRGGHNPDAGKACVQEWVSVKWMMTRYGMTLDEAWAMLTDSPECTEPLIYRAAQIVNDRLSDDERQRLVPLIDRLMLAHRVSDPDESQRCLVRVSCWAARSVVHLIADDERRAVALRAIETAERWLRGEAGRSECRSAADVAYAAYAAAAAAADAAAADAEIDLVLWLDDLLDQWEKARAEEGVLHEEAAS